MVDVIHTICRQDEQVFCFWFVQTTNSLSYLYHINQHHCVKPILSICCWENERMCGKIPSELKFTSCHFIAELKSTNDFVLKRRFNFLNEAEWVAKATRYNWKRCGSGSYEPWKKWKFQYRFSFGNGFCAHGKPDQERESENCMKHKRARKVLHIRQYLFDYGISWRMLDNTSLQITTEQIFETVFRAALCFSLSVFFIHVLYTLMCYVFAGIFAVSAETRA